MVIELLFEVLLGALTAMLEAIPNGELDTGTYIDDFAEMVGGGVGALDAVVPVTEAMFMLSWVLITYVPCVIAFTIARWVFTHLPVIGNGG